MEKRFRKIVAGVSAAALAVTTMLSNVWAEGTDEYPFPYTLYNILTDYQYFTFENLDIGNHTVGGVAVGGALTATATIGDGQYRVASYANNIVSANFGDGNYSVVPEGKKFYYKTKDDVSISDDDSIFIQNSDYIDFDRALKNINYESQQLYSSATPVLDSDISEAWVNGPKILNINLNEHNDYLIDYNLIVDNNIQSINFMLDDVGDFFKYSYSISIINVNDSSILLGSGGLGLRFNGSDNTDTLLMSWVSNNKDPDFTSAEIYYLGMKLIWNFPDAENITHTSLNGHLVAPNANVTLSGGRFEGGVIAKNVVSNSAEAHYYPYYDPRVPSQYDPNEPTIPDGTNPETPAVTTPAVTTPAVTTPAVTTPAVTTPAVTTPAVTTPAVTTPAVTTPAVTTPAVTTPAVTTPAVTTPAVTTPAVTTPAVTTPAVTTSVVITPSKPYYPPYEDTEQETTAPATTPAETTAAETTPAETTAPATTAPETKAPEISTAQTPKVTFVDIDPETEETTSETSKTIASEAENGGDSGLAENEYETDANGNPIRPDETDTNGGNGVDGSSENPETGIENLIVLPIMLGAAATAFALSKKRKNSSK